MSEETRNKNFYVHIKTQNSALDRPTHRSRREHPRHNPPTLLLLCSSINPLTTVIMDKFAVLKQIGTYCPTVDNTFNNVADAVAYANIMRRKNDGWTYNVYQLNEEL